MAQFEAVSLPKKKGDPMLLVFVDETSDMKFKDYLGFSIAAINAKFYPKIKTDALKVLMEIGWDPQVEFKGSYLFSQTKGCTDVDIEKRIDAAHRLLDLNVASKNRRMRFTYGRMKSQNHKADYLEALPSLLSMALPKPGQGAGKNLTAIACDRRSDIAQTEVHKALSRVIDESGYVLLEEVTVVGSSFETVGIMFADLVGYLTGRVDNIANDAELFEGLSPEQFETNGKIRKLRSSQDLISKIKKHTMYVHSSLSNESGAA